MINLIGSLTPLAWKWIATGVLSVVLVGSCAMRDRSIEQRGAAKASKKIEEATNNAAQKGAAAARKSRTPGVRGQRDPTTRDD